MPIAGSIHRRRYERTCGCPGSRPLTAPPVPKLIPKGLYGTSIWVEMLLDKYLALGPPSTCGFLAVGGLGPGTGYRHRRLAAVGDPAAADLRGAQGADSEGDLHLGDETRWRVFVPMEGKEGYGWWLWLVKGLDTVIYLLDPSRSHTVVENHFGAQSRGVLVVDRYAAYKAMIWVKDGVIVLAFCWSHVRRDFIRVGKGWPELKTWALEWLRRIRLLYRLNDRRLAVQRTRRRSGKRTAACARPSPR